MNAIGYVRVSTEDQAKEGVSLAAQRTKIIAYCQLKDLQLSEIIEDVGLPDEASAKSGISAKNLRRPGAQRVLTLARKKQVDAVVVYKLDRMFRLRIDTFENSIMLERQRVSMHRKAFLQKP